jgi:hypothetical protein
MCCAYFESRVQAKVAQQDFYRYKTLQMRTIHDFEPIQRRQVKCPLFLVFECKKLEHVFVDEQGDAFNRLPIQRR